MEDVNEMAKIKDVIYNKESYGWRINCPACKQIHVVNKTWSFNGEYEKPTLSPSLLVTALFMGDIENYVCHSFVTDGNIQFLSDCTHDMAGITVELPDV
ncbi:hypothetical protein D3C80_1737640 [compost metagenome]